MINKALKEFKNWMNIENIDAYLIMDYNKYLDTSIPLEENIRYILTKFKGSKGECIIFKSKQQGVLFVDGRYHLQAKEEVDKNDFYIYEVPDNTNNIFSIRSYIFKYLEKYNQKNTDKWVLGFDFYCLSYLEYQFLFANKSMNFVRRKISIKNIKYPRKFYDKKSSKFLSEKFLSKIPLNISGITTKDKLSILYSKNKIFEWILITSLDDLSYLCNIRYYGNLFSSIFNGFALIGNEKNFLFLEDDLCTSLNLDQIKNYFPLFEVFSDRKWKEIYQKIQDENPDFKILYYNVNSISIGKFRDLSTFKNIKLKMDPFKKIPILRSIKNSFEVKHVKEAYKRTDEVFDEIILWINNQLDNGVEISEKTIEVKLKKLFNQKGGKYLSFPSIVASGKNSAFIHYSNVNNRSFIKPGNLLLIDAGAYFEGGYATDLTRTYWIKSKSEKIKQIYKEIYTLVLKACIQVMKYTFKKGTKANVLDKIARDCLKSYGYTFKHSLGHGLGIFVHEYPPIISSKSMDVLKEFMIFTVEPGIYMEGIGGVRIENAVMVIKNIEKLDYLSLEPISFAKLEYNLIDMKFLDSQERNWLKMYQLK